MENPERKPEGVKDRRVISAGFFINVPFPGLGTVIAGSVRKGLMQVLLFAGGLALGILGAKISSALPLPGIASAFAGAAMMVVAWGWSITVTFFLLRNSANP